MINKMGTGKQGRKQKKTNKKKPTQGHFRPITTATPPPHPLLPYRANVSFSHALLPVSVSVVMRACRCRSRG